MAKALTAEEARQPMAEYVTVTGDILTTGTMVKATVRLRPVQFGHLDWGVIESMTPGEGFTSTARVRDMQGHVRDIPLTFLQLHPEFPWSVILPKEDE